MTITLVLAILMASVFIPLTLLLFMHYMHERMLKRLHLFAAFAFASLGFLANTLGEVIFLTSGASSVVAISFKFFDTFEMIGVFLFFVFLTDFVESQRKYLAFSFLALLIVIVAIFISPLSITKQGLSLLWMRSLWAGVAIILYWLVHFGVISYQFWRYSTFLDEKEPRARIQLMAGGGVFAILAYLAAILFELVFPHLVVFSGPIASAFALLSGILFYLGAEMPNWLKSLIA